MSSFKIRPRFRQHFKAQPDEIKLLFQDRIEHENDEDIHATFSGRHIILKVKEEDRHYWSPQLNISVEEDEEEGDGSLVRGLYGPPPSVWTMFAFGYFALGVAFLITGIIAYTYYSLDKESMLVWLLPIYTVLALALYMIAQFGQKLGAEQTFQLHHFYEETVGKRISIG